MSHYMHLICIACIHCFNISPSMEVNKKIINMVQMCDNCIHIKIHVMQCLIHNILQYSNVF